MTTNLQKRVNNLQIKFCPFSYLDLEFCLDVALKIDQDEDWVYETIENYQSETGIELNEIDPCFVVYQEIANLARNVLGVLQGIDDIADLYDIYPNFLCTSFVASTESAEKLNKLLEENGISVEDLDLATQYFINQIN